MEATTDRTTDSKRAVSLSVSEAALQEAEAAGLDIACVLEDALRARSHIMRADRWRAENREAIAWHNALVERMGGTLHEILADDDAV